MSEIAKFDLSPDSSTTLRKMLRLNIMPYMDQFEIISASATKVLKVVFTACRL
jgi:dynein heavy chain